MSLAKVWGITGYRRPFTISSTFIRQTDVKFVADKAIEFVEHFDNQDTDTKRVIRPYECLACNMYLTEDDAYKAAERREKERKANPGRVVPICHVASDMQGNVVTVAIKAE